MRAPVAFVRAWCRTMAGWLEESEFRSGSPIATTVLETVPASAVLATSAVSILDAWAAIVARVVVNEVETAASAKRRAETLVAVVEGGLILCRIRQTRAPLTAIADQFGREWGGINQVSRHQAGCVGKSPVAKAIDERFGD